MKNPGEQKREYEKKNQKMQEEKCNPNQDYDQTREEREPEQQICSRCDMPQKEWDFSEGYRNGDKIYCCQGCAEDTGCTCE